MSYGKVSLIYFRSFWQETAKNLAKKSAFFQVLPPFADFWLISALFRDLPAQGSAPQQVVWRSQSKFDNKMPSVTEVSHPNLFISIENADFLYQLPFLRLSTGEN